MSAYLQRLYDAAGTSVAVYTRPAQLSSSPLLAVDQRLASPAYARAFLLGLPGEVDPEPGAVPEPDLLTSSEPARRDAVLAPDQAPVRLPPPRPAPSAALLPDLEERVVLHPRPAAETGSPTQPSPHPDGVAPTATPAPVAPSQTPGPRPARTAKVASVRPVEERPQTDERASSPVEPRPDLRAGEPAHPRQADPVRTATETAPHPAPVSARPEAPGPPPLLHPIPASPPEPLPPVPAPSTAAPADLAEQVHRLVREAMSSEPTRPRGARDQEAGPAVESTSSASRPRTAEAMSVIGPLDRPARVTMLYGLRLR